MKKFHIAVLIALFIVLNSNAIYASHIPGVDKDPDYAFREDWSPKYIDLFKQAINQKYGIDNTLLENNLIVTGVTKGSKLDGFLIPQLNESIGGISFIYIIEWLPYHGVVEFDVADESGNDLTDQQILDSMKEVITPVFKSKIIPKQQATGSCSPAVEFPLLQSPGYSNDNNARFVKTVVNETITVEDLLFNCYKTVNEQENRCSTEVFSLSTGDKLTSFEGACVVYAAGEKGIVDFGGLQSSLIPLIAGFVLVAILLMVIIKYKKV